MNSTRSNNHRAIIAGYLEDSKKNPKKIPDWKRSELEIKAMEKKIGYGEDKTPEPSVIWKFDSQSLTDLDRKILAERKVEQAKLEAENGIRKSNKEEAEIQQLEEKVKEAEFRAETLEADYLRKTGVIPAYY